MYIHAYVSIRTPREPELLSGELANAEHGPVGAATLGGTGGEETSNWTFQCTPSKGFRIRFLVSLMYMAVASWVGVIGLTVYWWPRRRVCKKLDFKRGGRVH